MLRAPGAVVWRKRRWRCREALCDAKTWTERSEHVDARAVITRAPGWRHAVRSVNTPGRSKSSRTSSGCDGGRS